MPVLFTDERPDVYTINQIYDPDTNPSGTVIPRPGSLVIDPNNEGLLYYVVSVDDITKKPTYDYVKTSIIKSILTDQEEDYVKVVDYVNTEFFIYCNTATKPNRLIPDRRYIIIGKEPYYYVIYKRNEDGSKSVISANYDLSGNFQGNKIYLKSVSIDESLSNIKYLPECYSLVNLEDGEVLEIEIYDHYNNILTKLYMTIKLVKYFSYEETSDPIIKFEVNASQELDDGTFYMFVGQEKESLSISPELIYASGKHKQISIDNVKCFMYGWDDFYPSYPGQKHKLLFKYYLSPNELVDPNQVEVQEGNFILTEKLIKVLSPTGIDDFTLKISTIPLYDQSFGQYFLKFYLYSQKFNSVIDVTNIVDIEGSFDPVNFSDWQYIQLKLLLKEVLPITDNTLYIQNVYIRLKPFVYDEKYLIRDDMNDDYGVYGADTPTLRRPVIFCNEDNNTYYIPTSRFPSEDSFIEAFYLKARPPFDTEQYTDPIQPTHFTIRNPINGTLLLTSPQKVEDYNVPMSLQYSFPTFNVTVIVEFLKQNDDGSYQVLYGVPVDILQP